MYQSLRYLFLSNIDKLALSKEHANLLEFILRKIDIETINVKCVTPEINTKIIDTFFKDKKILIPIFPDITEFTTKDFWIFHYILFLISLKEKKLDLYKNLIKLILNFNYLYITRIVIPIFKNEIIKNIQMLKMISYFPIGEITEPKMKIHSISSLGVDLKLYTIKDEILKDRIVKAYEEENLICTKWQNALYVLINKSVSMTSLNLMFKKYRVNKVCHELEKYVEKAKEEESMCSRFNSYKLLYKYLYTFILLNTNRLYIKDHILYNIEIIDLIYNYIKE